MNHGLIPYIGGKHRIAHALVDACVATKADTFVDVFGGSAAVLLAASGKFQKLIYNDIDGDLVNLFRTIADDGRRRLLFKLLRWLPPSRRIYNDDHAIYVAGGFSFSGCADPVERARRTLYRHCFAFGGKVRSGGFAISSGDRPHHKQVLRYRNTLQKLARIGSMFRGVLIENLDYQDAIRLYGRVGSCLYVDPPYDGTENHYSRGFQSGGHVFLAEQLARTAAKVVCSYYDTPLIRSLYPSSEWTWTGIEAVKNSGTPGGKKEKTTEFLITRRGAA